MKRLVVTVTPETEQELFDGICRGFEERLGERLCAERADDPSIIGGFIADIEGDVYDASIASRLKEMAKHIRS